MKNNILYIKHVRSISISYSIAARVLGRNYYIKHGTYDNITSALLFTFMMIAPVAAIAIQGVN